MTELTTTDIYIIIAATAFITAAFYVMLHIVVRHWINNSWAEKIIISLGLIFGFMRLTTSQKTTVYSPDDQIDFSALDSRVIFVLKQNKFTTWKQVATLTEKQILYYRNSGTATLMKIKIELKKRGLKLSTHKPFNP